MRLKQIGKGSFSIVYKVNTNKVLIKSNDYVKECIALGWGFDSNLFPKIKFENTNNFTNIYTMKLYPKCTAPKRQLNKKAYQRYSLLRKLFQDAFGINKYDGFNYWHKKFKSIKDNNLRNALLSALDGLSNYGSDIHFEISPRNISFTKTGNIILLDCFFFKTQLEKVQGR